MLVFREQRYNLYLKVPKIERGVYLNILATIMGAQS